MEVEEVLVQVQSRKKLMGMWMSENPGEDVPQNPHAAGPGELPCVCRLSMLG